MTERAKRIKWAAPIDGWESADAIMALWDLSTSELCRSVFTALAKCHFRLSSQTDGVSSVEMHFDGNGDSILCINTHTHIYIYGHAQSRPEVWRRTLILTHLHKVCCLILYNGKLIYSRILRGMTNQVPLCLEKEPLRAKIHLKKKPADFWPWLCICTHTHTLFIFFH